mmetsp:Transcript_30943/g.27374  ORF Transcript_30943/g.27374 Transcript_30943/m.27374 type:complete len:105 (+) Transcript_30943:624-938(+)
MYEQELAFSKQMWNRINQFLFNFIDSIILVDVLEILFGKHEKKAIQEFDKYVGVVNISSQISHEDISINLKRNKELEINEIWETVEIYSFFKNKKPMNYQERDM